MTTSTAYVSYPGPPAPFSSYSASRPHHDTTALSFPTRIESLVHLFLVRTSRLLLTPIPRSRNFFSRSQVPLKVKSPSNRDLGTHFLVIRCLQRLSLPWDLEERARTEVRKEPLRWNSSQASESSGGSGTQEFGDFQNNILRQLHLPSLTLEHGGQSSKIEPSSYHRLST